MKMNILVTLDAGYLDPLTVMLRSLVDNHRCELDVYVMNSALTEEHLNRVRRGVEAYCEAEASRRLRLIDVKVDSGMLKDAPIVVLDEATANVDPENEDRLQTAIEALTHEKTVVMIAHRLKTVRSADQILVLSGGRIVQKGTHAELAAQDGIYRDFITERQQAADWKL